MKKKYYCINCQKQLSDYRHKRCISCNVRYLWANTNKRIKVITALTKDFGRRKCILCQKDFKIKANNKKQRFCSLSCRSKISGLAKKPNNGGLREGGGFQKLYSYISPFAGKIKLNKDEIEVAKILDNLKLNWVRNKKGFNYNTLDNKSRKYYPDFYIKDYNYYVEYKGWLDKENSHKMTDAVKNNNFNLLIIFSNDKRYKDLGLNLDRIKNHPLELIQNFT